MRARVHDKCSLLPQQQTKVNRLPSIGWAAWMITANVTICNLVKYMHVIIKFYNLNIVTGQGLHADYCYCHAIMV